MASSERVKEQVASGYKYLNDVYFGTGGLDDDYWSNVIGLNSWDKKRFLKGIYGRELRQAFGSANPKLIPISHTHGNYEFEDDEEIPRPPTGAPSGFDIAIFTPVMGGRTQSGMLRRSTLYHEGTGFIETSWAKLVHRRRATATYLEVDATTVKRRLMADGDMPQLRSDLRYIANIHTAPLPGPQSSIDQWMSVEPFIV